MIFYKVTWPKDSKQKHWHLNVECHWYEWKFLFFWGSVSFLTLKLHRVAVSPDVSPRRPDPGYRSHGFPFQIHQHCTSWMLSLRPRLSGTSLPCSTTEIWLQAFWWLASRHVCRRCGLYSRLSWRWHTVRNVLHGLPLKSHWTQYQIHRPVGATGSIANNNKPQAPILKLAN